MYSCFDYHCFPYSFYTYRQRLDPLLFSRLCDELVLLVRLFLWLLVPSGFRHEWEETIRGGRCQRWREMVDYRYVQHVRQLSGVFTLCLGPIRCRTCCTRGCDSRISFDVRKDHTLVERKSTYVYSVQRVTRLRKAMLSCIMVSTVKHTTKLLQWKREAFSRGSLVYACVREWR